ncbi:MAG TPA: ABC transporter permease [Gemmataceae bacterium]|nr:ABC transporter permease [Gemmataceae bacterium]
MDAPTAAAQVKINRWLPYWAVFQADVRQTLQSWVYRTWVFVSVLVTVGYSLYRYGAEHEAGILQSASHLVSDLLRWTLLGSVTLIIVLTVGSISSERGTMADSILSRGISRYQYFLGKWHARLVTILATFFVLGAAALVSCHFLLHEDLSLIGSVAALVMVAALLAVVSTCGVTVSALTNSTVVGITALWVAVYGVGIVLSFLTRSTPSPTWLLQVLPNVLHGHFSWYTVARFVGWSALTSAVAAVFGLGYFSRRDV